MNAALISALLPLLVLAGGIVVLLVVVAWLRSDVVAFAGALVVLGAAIAVMPLALAAGVQDVDGLLDIDGYALFFQGMFALAAAATAVLSYRYLEPSAGEREGLAPRKKEPRAAHTQEFYILLLVATLGASVTAATDHFAGFLLGIEVLSISLYAMIAYPQEGRGPLEAAAKYLVLSGAGTSTMLFGMALIYVVTGTLEFAPAGDIGTNEHLLLAVGQAMLLIGVFFKLSLVPFHMWTPDVYQGAPAPVTGFVATVSKAAVFAVLMRYAIDVGVLDADADVLRNVMVVVAVLSMIAGNLLALLQTNIKRLLAYSSIAHMGYLLIAVVVAATPEVRAFGVETALVYLAGYVVMTLAAFGVVTVLSDAEEDAEELTAYDGIFWRRPVLAAVLAAAALSLAGIPLTVGFIAKFYLVAAGVDGAAWVLVWALIVGSAIGIYYYLRIVFSMTKRSEPSAGAPRMGESETESLPIAWEGVVAVVVLGVSIVVLGVFPAPVVDFVGALAGP